MSDWRIDERVIANLRADLAKAQAESEAAAKRWDEEREPRCAARQGAGQVRGVGGR